MFPKIIILIMKVFIEYIIDLESNDSPSFGEAITQSGIDQGKLLVLHRRKSQGLRIEGLDFLIYINNT